MCSHSQIKKKVELLKISQKKFIGRCIYCGYIGNGLSNEHALPYGLNGEWILEKASCTNCSKITSKIELQVLRGIYQSARVSFNARSRKGLPKTFRLTGEDIQGKVFTIDLPVKKYGAVICLLGYGLPAYFDSKPSIQGIYVADAILIRAKGEDLSQLAKSFGLKKIILTQIFQQQSFERFLAKVAFCMAVFYFGLEALEYVYVLPAIKNHADDIGRWVGSFPPEKGDKDIDIRLDVDSKRDVLCSIRIFGTLKVFTYIVVVGKLKLEL